LTRPEAELLRPFPTGWLNVQLQHADVMSDAPDRRV
jgi:hypothetical protein